MPVNVVHSAADEAKWKRAKKIVRKQYGGVESKGKFPVVMHIYQNMKKHASADEIFWTAVTDELEKVGAVPPGFFRRISTHAGQTASDLAKTLLKAHKAGTLTPTQKRLAQRLAEVHAAGGNLKAYTRKFVL